MYRTPTAYASNLGGNLYIYIDNSNLWIQGQKTYAQTHKQTVSRDPTWRFDVGRLKAILMNNSTLRAEKEDTKVAVNLYGSTPSPVDTVWQVIESHKVNVSTFARSFWTGREKKVDTSIIADSVDQAAESYFNGTTSEFMFVSGDVDLNAAVLKIVQKGFLVHVWAWKNCLSAEYLTQEKNVQVHFLDDHLEDVGFRESTFRVDRASINPYSIVILDPLSKAKEIDEVISKIKIPLYRYEQEPGRAEGSVSDLIIIPATPNRMEQKELNALFQTVRSQLEQHGLRVMTYFEYSQNSFKSSEPQSPTSNRFESLVNAKVADDMKNKTQDDDDDDEDSSAAAREAAEDYTEVNRGAKQYNSRLKKDQEKERMRCKWRKYCPSGINCKFGHTDEEKNHFMAFGSKKARKYKLCRNKNCYQGRQCNFAHGEAELLCPTCGVTGAGHEMHNCPNRNFWQ